MVQSRQKTGSEAARLPKISRRAIIAGTTVASFGPSKVADTAASPDQTVKLYGSWLQVNAKIEQLQTRWAKLEAKLVKEQRWFSLTETERQALPWTQKLDDIDAVIAILYRKLETITENLPMTGAASVEALISKLLVAERMVCREDHPQAHDIIEGSARDLMALPIAKVGAPMAALLQS